MSTEYTEYIEHTTKEGERWDWISWLYYVDPFKYEIIIKENPSVVIDPILEAGITLYIPILEEPETTEEDLPPWKQ